MRNGTALGLIYTCSYDSLWVFKHIFTDFENFRFVSTPYHPIFRSSFRGIIVKNVKKMFKILKITKIAKVVKNRF